MAGIFKSKIFLSLAAAVVLLAVVLIAVPFGKADNDDINNDIIDMIAEVETSNHDINTLKISYDDYKKKTNRFLSKYFDSFLKKNDIIYAEDDFVFSITGEHFNEVDLKGMTMEELKKIGEPLMQSLVPCRKAYFYDSFDISKVYDDNSSADTSMHFKHVYVRRIYDIDSKYYITYKKYVLKREGKGYVLFSVNLVVEDPNKELIFGSEKVQFIKSVSF